MVCLLITNGWNHPSPLLAPLDFLQHFLAHVLGELSLKLVFLNFADFSVVETLPHDKELLNFFCFALFLTELLD